ncbi:hypothetical protein COCC4DRAFT_46109 [Bipolaris maydis ATCC 48331]|uniref:Uncharacterized protein n=1 Tax=Cochliobolus heterostrophus (strain C4 / ATCC 48331 / race T) TaxID=665024 RepID=N4XBC4_COCH4|nr:uncharacterized protein COCC4DRAFT_46109 [Bipolaris maydis ATCC 48331]ENI10319.1 hypothetical protein COCC4DRAFT_46109 [Bipolaris maydis ATCC 48331]KAJ5065228.1 hypothetical protein J3E74DRAFT_414265 [Bipolaris maydis]KAJ6200442.1 hypothetical protein J3E72DRAFT_383005 [Bipolaris maydis]KAJ6213725.1 hypothetical protein PSV09DRAFT_2430699 [Bipolaris maydis]
MSLAFPHSKKPRKQYVLGDFVKYATGIFAAHFVAISDMGLYEFAEKQYIDKNLQCNTRHMVLTGHYHRKSSGPPVWAESTGEEIRYYKGTGCRVEPLIPDIQSGKVYYDPPFSYIGGTISNGDAGRGMTQERKFQRAVVESAIHFIFLATGRLNQTLDITNPDLLGHFKVALVNLLQNREAYEASHRTPIKEIPARVEETAITKNEAHPFKVSETRPRNSVFDIIRRPLPPIVAASLNRRVIDLTCDVPGSSSQAIDECVLLEQQVQDLKAKLEEQRARTSTLEARLAREKLRRQRLRDQRERWNIQKRALKAKVTAKRQRPAQCEATGLEHQLQIAAVKEELECEKKARMFWQYKHNSLPRMLLDRNRLSITSGAPNNQESSVALVRTPGAGAHKGSFGSGRSRPL